MTESKSKLRRQAEGKAALAPAKEVSLSPDEARRALHELAVHQIELEMQNEELRRAQTELEILQAKYFDLFDLALIGYCTLSLRGVILEANFTAVNLLGTTRGKLIRQPITRFIFKEDQDLFYRYRKNLFETGAPQAAELRLKRQNQEVFWANLEASVTHDASGSPVCRLVLSDISERRQASEYREMGRKVLEILNGPGDLREAMPRILEVIRALSGCDALGIRLEDGADFPYYAHSGFSEEFLRTENSLAERGASGGICRDKDGKVRLECTCGLVISGRHGVDASHFTNGGSFWTNDSSLLLDIPLGEDLRLHPRNRCVHNGYGSVALVPIRIGGGIVGLIQLNARNKGHFTLEAVERLEEIGLYIGEALLRCRMEDKLHSAAEELRRSNQDLEQFAYVASHDLQEPLRTISSFTKILADRYAAQLDDKAREYLGFTTEAAQRMAQLIDDLLTYSRVGRERGGGRLTSGARWRRPWPICRGVWPTPGPSSPAIPCRSSRLTSGRCPRFFRT